MLYSLSDFAESIVNFGKDDIVYNYLFKPPLLNYIKDYVLSYYIYTLENPLNIN